MLGACLSFITASDAGKEARVGVFMMLFILFYSFGQGPGRPGRTYRVHSH